MEKFNWKDTVKTNIFLLKLLGLWPKGIEGYKFNLYTFYSFSFANFKRSTSALWCPCGVAFTTVFWVSTDKNDIET
ncbi:hypothetical protein MTP99_008866 [Tenebrio molitor]|nr:hypothetical protein MTP99_008866 [Tenebrio molitor]